MPVSSKSIAARVHHGQRRGDDGAAHAEPQRIDLVHAADLARHVDRGDRPERQVVVPGHLRLGLVRVLPRDHEDRVPLLHRVADERVLRLQVEDVELVDARRHHDERPLVDLGCQRLVLDQLHQRVFVHHRALAGGDVASHFEGRLVGLRDLAFLQVAEQVVDAALQALAAAFQERLLGSGIEGEKVGRRRGLDPLVDRVPDALLGALVRLHRLGHAAHEIGIEQVGARQHRRGGVLLPGRVGKARILDGFGDPVRMLEKVGPQPTEALHVLALQVDQKLGREIQLRQRRRRAEVHLRQVLPQLHPALRWQYGRLSGAGVGRSGINRAGASADLSGWPRHARSRAGAGAGCPLNRCAALGCRAAPDCGRLAGRE
jgi:hypothetical protein